MIIGVDANEANVRERVGANIYAYNILCELHKIISNLKSQKSKPNVKCKIYLKNEPLSDLPPENENWQYKVFGPGKLWTQWRLPLELYLEREKPAVFFTPGHYAPRFSPVPTVVSIMDLAFLRFPQDFRHDDLSQLIAWTEYSVKKAAHILAISEATKQDIMEFYKIPSERITVTYPGYDNKRFMIYDLRFKNKIQEIKKNYEVKGDYLIYIGTLQPRKNLVRLIKTFSYLQKDPVFQNRPGLSLVIVGKKGWLYDEIFKTVKELNLEDKVIFTGFVPDDDLPLLLGGAQALILPSLYEGFGIPVAEAMACGVPVVVSRVSSLPEIAGKAGIYIDDPESGENISQALLKVLKLTDQERKRLVERGLERVKQFSWEKCARETLKILLEETKDSAARSNGK